MNLPTKPTCGVYLIRCAANGRIYVGGSRNVEQRRRDHLSSLRRGVHGNPHLQRAWDKYGPDAFSFEVVATPAPARLLEVEQLFIDAVFRLGIALNGNRHSHTRAPTSRRRERQVARLFSKVTADEWATNSNVAIAKRLGVAIWTAGLHRPASIPSPGSSREYLSKATRSALAAKRRA